MFLDTTGDTNNNILISIVTVCRSSSGDLQDTLLPFSYLGVQDRRYLQHIVVLGERDPSLVSLASGFASEGCIMFDTAKGPYAAMNLGATLAVGRYIWFLNSGDIPEITLLSEVIGSLRLTDAKLCSFACSMVGPRSTSLWAPALNDLPLGTLPHPSLLFDRELFWSLGGFNLSLKYVADRDLIVRSFIVGSSIHFFPGSLARYCSSFDSLSSSYKAALEDIKLTLSLGLFPKFSSLVDFLAKYFRHIFSEISDFTSFLGAKS